MTPIHWRRRTAGVLAIVLGLMCFPAAGQTAAPPLPEVRAARTSLPPVIDGRLIDEGWVLAEPASSFTQRDPNEGEPPTERTEIRFLYDDEALYVAARLFDSDPSRI